MAGVKHQTEIELKFLVPAAVRAELAREMARGSASLNRSSLAARYLDTPERLLARAGLAWRLRREGSVWIQTLKAGGRHALERFEHEVIRPDASHDASLHAGTPAGDRLLALLRRAQADGIEPVVRFQTEVRRTSRRIRTRGAVVEVAFDEGRLLAADRSLRIREIEFELSTGSVTAMLALAERWRKRFGLVYDPRSKAERGDQLAGGSPYPPLHKAARPAYARGASASTAYGAVLDECLAQITRNAIGVCEGDPALRVEHVHQLRVGIRRLRSALRSFDGWVPTAPPTLIEDMRRLFVTLGQARDGDVMDSGVVVELAKAGAPPLTLPAGSAGPDVVAAVAASPTQKALLGWINWRVELAEQPSSPPERTAEPLGEASPAADTPASRPGPAEPDAPKAVKVNARAFRRSAERRLRKWHARVAADANDFDQLDDEALHALRKRIKRLRYAVEFFAPVLRDGQVTRYLRVLAALQDHMGVLNDLFVARARYQRLVAADAGAWFALGWLAARIAQVRAGAKPAIVRLAKTSPPAA